MQKNKIICGLDPGFSGAVAILDPCADSGKQVLLLEDMPTVAVGREGKRELDEPLIVSTLMVYKVTDVFIEKAQAMPGQGVVSTGRYLMSYGILRGICAGLHIRYHLIHPKTWKKAMMSDMPKEKGASIIRAKQLFPNLDLHRKKDHGKCDALLIAAYGAKQI